MAIREASFQIYQIQLKLRNAIIIYATNYAIKFITKMKKKQYKITVFLWKTNNNTIITQVNNKQINIHRRIYFLM